MAYFTTVQCCRCGGVVLQNAAEKPPGGQVRWTLRGWIRGVNEPSQSFTVSLCPEKAPTRAFSLLKVRREGECPSRGLLRTLKTFVDGSSLDRGGGSQCQGKPLTRPPPAPAVRCYGDQAFTFHRFDQPSPGPAPSNTVECFIATLCLPWQWKKWKWNPH